MRLPARLLGALRDAGAAGPDLILGVTCLLALFLPRIEAQFGSKIGMLIGLEFMGLHAFGFLGRIIVADPGTRSGQILRVAAVIGLSSSTRSSSTTGGDTPSSRSGS